MKNKPTFLDSTPYVLYEDNHLIAVWKPGGWLVQGDETGDVTLADWTKEYIKQRYQKPGAVFLGITHRLDRVVTGAVIFARTSKALSRMNDLFRNRKVDKTYLAIVANRPEPLEGRLEHLVKKDTEKNVAKAFDRESNRSQGAKKAVTEYEFVGTIGEHNLLKVKPITGRPHQIRVQLAKIGSTIRGDKKYGARGSHRNQAIYLHCHRMEFVHPVRKEPLSITASLPDEQVWRLFRPIVADL